MQTYGQRLLQAVGDTVLSMVSLIIGAAAALWFNHVKNPVIHVRLKGYRFLWQDVTDIYRVWLPTMTRLAMPI